METIAIHQAKTTLSRLVKRAAGGETIFIGGYGKPEAVLAPVEIVQPGAGLRKRRIGIMSGELVVPDDFDAPLPNDILAAFGDT